MIQRINSINNPVFINNTQHRRVMSFACDDFYCENKNINKVPLVERGILLKYQSVNRFYEDISKRFFENKKAQEFANHLKNGDMMLSSSILSQGEISAKAITLNEQDNIDLIRSYVQEGIGLGFNFSEFKNPADEIRKINYYYKAHEDNYIRPPAFIGLLDVNHKKINDFIELKTKERFSGWCFDLSVIIDDNFMEKLNQGDKKTLKTYNLLLESMSKSGEPGIIFSNNKNYLTDCCAAVELEENQGFSSASVNLSNMYREGKIDYSYLKKCSNILAEAMKKTENPYIGILGYGDLLEKMNIKYGSKEALDVLSKCLDTVKKECDRNKVSMAIVPTGTTSRILKTTPSIEPKTKCSINEKLDTLEVAYKYIDGKGRVSTTINVDNLKVEDVDYIIRKAYQKGIKELTVYPNKD